MLVSFSKEIVLYVEADLVCLGGSEFRIFLCHHLGLPPEVASCPSLTVVIHCHLQTFNERLLPSIGKGICHHFYLTNMHSVLAMCQAL